MRLFLDASVLLAAAGSVKGSSHGLFRYAVSLRWHLQTSAYAVEEVERNLPKLSPEAPSRWLWLRPQLHVVDDIISIDRPAVFPAHKDRPILFTALACADVLLTLDKADFASLLGRHFYGLRIMLPYEFLREQRDAGRLKLHP